MYGYTIGHTLTLRVIGMRRKKLDVVFNDSVNIHAEKIVKQLNECNTSIESCTVNKSEVIRGAMELGLRIIQDKVDSQIEKGLCPKGVIKIANLRAEIRK